MLAREGGCVFVLQIPSTSFQDTQGPRGRKEGKRESKQQAGSLCPLPVSGPLSCQGAGYGVPWDTFGGLWWRG